MGNNILFQKDSMRMPFTPKMAEKSQISYSKLKRLFREGVVERLERGVYRKAKTGPLSSTPETSFALASARIGLPNAICLLSALEYYHLTDEISSQTWLLVPTTKRSVHPDLKLIRTSKPRWGIGIEQHEGFKITSLERTLVDALTNTRNLGKILGIEALKRALSEQKTTLEKVTEMASRLGVFHRIQPIVEVLL